MITRLRFKNWRSLRDVEIDHLTPITVFVGANSSGKSNIVDGLNFFGHALDHDIQETIYLWGGYHQIHTYGVDVSQETAIGITFGKTDQVPISPINHELTVNFEFDSKYPMIGESSNWSGDIDADSKLVVRMLLNRCQVLDEGFMPSLSVPSNKEPMSLHVIDRQAKNVPFILDFFRQRRPAIFGQIQDDLRWLLDHVDAIETTRDANKTRLFVHEKQLNRQVAPTISAGTARVVAMLTAMYVLDMYDSERPGLVVIEEPDTAVHPLLLRKLVELFRTFVDNREGNRPRQLLLTTHNLRFLNLFEPEEVRIVERDEKGETTVKPVPKNITDIWLDEYGLGDVWVTRILGGVPD